MTLMTSPVTSRDLTGDATRITRDVTRDVAREVIWRESVDPRRGSACPPLGCSWTTKVPVCLCTNCGTPHV